MDASMQQRKSEDVTKEVSSAGGRPGAPPRLLRHTASRLGWGSVVDGVLGGTGGLAAVACAGFAIYMAEHPRPAFNGIEHLMIFAQPNYAVQPAVAETNSPADRKGIDYSATGTIRGADTRVPGIINFGEPVVAAYKLHYVHDGEALIVGRDDAVYRVALGSIVPGVGPVLAIEERRGQWVVVTPRGLIVAR
jgi:hypothetical protein